MINYDLDTTTHWTCTGVSFINSEHSLRNNNFNQFYLNFPEFIIPNSSEIMNNKKKSNKIRMKKEKRLHFWELPDTIRIRLDKKFSKDLFDKLLTKSNSKIIAKKLQGGETKSQNVLI